jgi:hypothetical protein
MRTSCRKPLDLPKLRTKHCQPLALDAWVQYPSKMSKHGHHLKESKLAAAYLQRPNIRNEVKKITISIYKSTLSNP